MIFKITLQPLTDTGRSFVPKGKTISTFAVGDAFSGWLTEQKRRLVHRDLERTAKHYGYSQFQERVLEHGRWEIVSSELY